VNLRVLAVVLLAGAASTARAQQASPRWGSFELGAGPYRPDIDAEFGGSGPYEQVFGSSRHWQFRAGFGKSIYTGFGDLEVGLRSGFFRATGRAVYLDPNDPTGKTYLKSGDETSLWIVPTSLTVTYYFEYLAERFRWIPITLYGRGALERYNWWTSTSGGTSKRGATNGWSVTGGAALLLDSFDPGLARDLDNETGINHTYLFFDVTHAKVDDFGSSKSWDLSPDKLQYGFGLLMMF
jgi:hypothetical protein